MAQRPAFFANYNDRNNPVKKEDFSFKWHSGFAVSQKQKSINDFHLSIKNKYGNLNILEISSKSEDPYGKKLSAFNLTFKYKDKFISVESAFQSSKVFENGGPYTDILFKSSLEAKKDERIKNGINLLYFSFFNNVWDLIPTTSFYDWIYINALSQQHNKYLAEYILNFDCFTDIEFNPEKSFNCQAGSVALYNYLYKNNLLKKALSSKENYISIITNRIIEDRPVIAKNLRVVQGDLLKDN